VKIGIKIQTTATALGFKGCIIGSAKEDDNIDEAMWYLVESILDTLEDPNKGQASRPVAPTPKPKQGALTSVLFAIACVADLHH
jgi:hypothetical protein